MVRSTAPRINAIAARCEPACRWTPSADRARRRWAGLPHFRDGDFLSAMRPKGLTQMNHDVSVIPRMACCDSKVVQCFAVHCFVMPELGRAFLTSERQSDIDSTGREAVGSEQRF